MKVILSVVEGPKAGRTFEFAEPDSFLIGRSSHAHLRVDDQADRFVSRNHCLLEIRPPRCSLIDLDSTNGTYVNGEKTRQAELGNGDEIRVGKTKIRLAVEDAPTEKQSVVLCFLCRKNVTRELHDYPPGLLDGLVYLCRSCRKKEEERLRAEKTEWAGLIPEKSIPLCGTCRAELPPSAASSRPRDRIDNRLFLCPRCAVREQHPGVEFRTMGRYFILTEIGRGAKGVVFKAVHQDTHQVWAVKRILPAFIRDEATCRLFEREIKVQSMIRHPNLVSLVDQGRAGITPFLVTEFMPAGDVETLMTEVWNNPLPPPLACNLAIQVLKGVEMLHSRGLVHRDLKPTNFLLAKSPDGKNFVVKVSDFGLAKSYEDAGNSLFAHTGAGDFGGTPMFMPPEQILDYRHVKPPADVYALGVSLYYLLSGCYPVQFPTPLERRRGLKRRGKSRNPLDMILEDDPIPLVKRNPGLHRSLAALVDKAVVKEGHIRLQTARDFRAQLEKIMTQEGWPLPYDPHPGGN
jgi:eukaryotic-like serine/threonine-protein kinase